MASFFWRTFVPPFQIENFNLFFVSFRISFHTYSLHSPQILSILFFATFFFSFLILFHLLFRFFSLILRIFYLILWKFHWIYLQIFKTCLKFQKFMRHKKFCTKFFQTLSHSLWFIWYFLCWTFFSFYTWPYLLYMCWRFFFFFYFYRNNIIMKCAKKIGAKTAIIPYELRTASIA